MRKPLTSNAKRLRSNSTEAEKYLWYMLRNKNLGVKFRRQVVIDRHIVDFACFERRIVIEVDGGQHAQSEQDNIRDQWLAGQGFKILRFWNHDVLVNRDGVLEKIVEHLNPPP
ncbi:MAG: DUF559 domain-containing protein [Candidatus Omnitrophota bacterium]